MVPITCMGGFIFKFTNPLGKTVFQIRLGRTRVEQSLSMRLKANDISLSLKLIGSNHFDTVCVVTKVEFVIPFCRDPSLLYRVLNPEYCPLHWIMSVDLPCSKVRVLNKHRENRENSISSTSRNIYKTRKNIKHGKYKKWAYVI